MLSVVENTISYDEDRQIESAVFKAKTVRMLLGLSDDNYRKIRTKIDPNGESRRDGFTHNIFFVYFIFYTLRERKFYSVSDIRKFKWAFIFEACEKMSLADIKEMGIVFCPMSKELWLTPKSEYNKAMKNPRFEGLELSYVYQDYVSHLALSFETLLERQMTHAEQAKLLLTQPNFRESVLGEGSKSKKDVADQEFNDYFSEFVKKL